MLGNSLHWLSQQLGIKSKCKKPICKHFISHRQCKPAYIQIPLEWQLVYDCVWVLAVWESVCVRVVSCVRVQGCVLRWQVSGCVCVCVSSPGGCVSPCPCCLAYWGCSSRTSSGGRRWAGPATAWQEAASRRPSCRSVTPKAGSTLASKHIRTSKSWWAADSWS